jgi:hypothetical protein
MSSFLRANSCKIEKDKLSKVQQNLNHRLTIETRTLLNILSINKSGTNSVIFHNQYFGHLCSHYNSEIDPSINSRLRNLKNTGFLEWFLQDLNDFLFEIIEEETLSDPTVHLKLMGIFLVRGGKN